jgi:hypothetical protein
MPDDGHAQPVPVTKIENADGDSLVHINQEGGFVVYGERFDGAIPAEGRGTRMMWYPAKAAFRAGDVGKRTSINDQWNDENIGQSSVALGRDTKASGFSSLATGSLTSAKSIFSTAMGDGTIASGETAMAMGKSTNASGDVSMAMGDNTTASGDFSTAMGIETEATGNTSVSMGNGTEASGVVSFATGSATTASGIGSTAMGSNTTAATPRSLSIGRYNDANTSDDNTLFVVGNGSDPSGFLGGRSDALVLDQSGNLEISGTLTENSDRRLKTQIQPLDNSVLAPLGEIEPVRFQFKDERTHPSGTQLGLIAQEVQAQFPALVSKGASGHLSVSYSKFTAVLLKGLQEQQSQIHKQREQIDRLRGPASRRCARRTTPSRSGSPGWSRQKRTRPRTPDGARRPPSAACSQCYSLPVVSSCGGASTLGQASRP